MGTEPASALPERGLKRQPPARTFHVAQSINLWCARDICRWDWKEGGRKV